MTETETKPALAGLRVIDAATFIAGPYAATILSEFGAEVIKVEQPEGGDPWRKYGTRTGRENASLAWLTEARNKKSVTLNLRVPEGQAMLRKLAETADVLIENFRPGTMEKWGLGFEDLRKVNPRLVMLRVTGYGQTGPYKDRPGFGSVVESLTGFAARNGFPDREPVLPPFALADSVAALQGAFATMVALREAEKEGGKGQVVDLALLEPLHAILGPEALIYRMTGKSRPRSGSASTTASPRNVYETKDGKFIGMSASIQTMAERVFRMIGRADMIDDPRYRTNMDRLKHREEVDAAVGAWIKTKSLAEVAAIFEEQEITASPIYEQDDIAKDPHFIEREVVVEVPDADLGWAPMQNVCPRLSDTPGSIRAPAPAIGEHSRAILAAAG